MSNNITYTKHTIGTGEEEHFVIKRSDGWFLTEDEEHYMYREYLAWVAEGNTAEPAD